MSLLLKEKKRTLHDDKNTLSFSDKITLFLEDEMVYCKKVRGGLLVSNPEVINNKFVFDKRGEYLYMVSPSERNKLFPVYYQDINVPETADAVVYRPYRVKTRHSENKISELKEESSNSIDPMNLLSKKVKESAHLDTEKKSPLSNEFKVATEIYRCEVEGKLVWYTKLVSLLKGDMSKNTVAKALNVLFDWGIVKSEFGETEKGRPGKLLKITNDSKGTISDLYYNLNSDESGDKY